MPMQAVYNDEDSNLKIHGILFQFPLKYFQQAGQTDVLQLLPQGFQYRFTGADPCIYIHDLRDNFRCLQMVRKYHHFPPGNCGDCNTCRLAGNPGLPVAHGVPTLRCFQCAPETHLGNDVRKSVDAVRVSPVPRLPAKREFTIEMIVPALKLEVDKRGKSCRQRCSKPENKEERRKHRMWQGPYRPDCHRSCSAIVQSFYFQADKGKNNSDPQHHPEPGLKPDVVLCAWNMIIRRI